MSPDPQPSLFDFTDTPGPKVAVTSALQLTPLHALPLSRWQREFNMLSAEVTALRGTLADVKDLLDTYRAHVAQVLEPRWRDMVAARRDWVLAADRVLQRQSTWPKAQRLTRKRQKHLAAFLLALIDDLLTDMDADDELTAIHDRYSDISLQESIELGQASMQSMLGQAVGKDAMQGRDDDDTDDADDVASILRRALGQLDAHMQRNQTRRDRQAQARGGPTKAERKREQAAKDVSQSLRDVYRKLASTLHPDREPDAIERARKTQLMQQANQAYEQGDLLQLLALQLSVLQTDANALARADDARLKLYCQALRDQRQVLATEIAQCEAPIRQALQHGPRGPLPERRALLAHVDSEAKRLKRGVAAMRSDIAQLMDPRTCAAAVDLLELR
jgi:hypothetical protein